VEFNLNGLPDNAVRISGFRGEDGRIVGLNAVSEVDIVFSYGQFVRIFLSDVPLMLLYPDVHGTARLPTVDSAALTGDPVNPVRGGP
jgi:hypothetical protein